MTLIESCAWIWSARFEFWKMLCVVAHGAEIIIKTRHSIQAGHRYAMGGLKISRAI